MNNKERIRKMNVTVADLIRTGHRKVKLGAADGIAFIYCGDIAMIGESAVSREIYARHIVDVYTSASEKNTFIVLFEGDEKGKYWTTAEYDAQEWKYECGFGKEKGDRIR